MDQFVTIKIVNILDCKTDKQKYQHLLARVPVASMGRFWSNWIFDQHFPGGDGPSMTTEMVEADRGMVEDRPTGGKPSSEIPVANM